MIGQGALVTAKKDSVRAKHWLISYKANLDKKALVHRFGPPALQLYFVLKTKDIADQILTHFLPGIR